MNQYIRDKTKFMAMHNAQIRTKDLIHTERSIIPLRYERKHIGDMAGSYKVFIHWVGLTTCCTFWLVTDVRRRSRSAPRSGHDVAGPDINLDFPEAHVGCETLLGSCHVALDLRPTEKQAPAGELAGFTTLGTRKACRSASDTCAG